MPQAVTNDESSLMARKGRRQQPHGYHPGKAELKKKKKKKGTNKKQSFWSRARRNLREWKQQQNPWGRKSGHLS